MLSDDELHEIFLHGVDSAKRSVDCSVVDETALGLRAVANAAAKNALKEAADELNVGHNPATLNGELRQIKRWLRVRATFLPTTTKENER